MHLFARIGDVLRGRLLVRAGAVAIGALVAFFAFWNAGVNPGEWLAKVPQKHAGPADQMTQLAKPVAAQKKPASTKPLPGTDSSISEKPLALLLSGTLPGRNAFEGAAMIGVTRENPQTYAAGAVLANGARLAEIHEKFVVLERKGRKAKLYLQELTNQYLAKSDTSDVLMVGGPQKIKPAVPTSVEPLTDYLRPSPMYDGEALRGYEVYPGKRSGVFYQMGLQAGDVITSIEGTTLSDSEQAFEMFRQLMDGMALTATINRKGKIQQVSLDGSMIAADQEQEKNAGASSSSSRMGIPLT